jgi:hypothetical protein
MKERQQVLGCDALACRVKGLRREFDGTDKEN